MPAPVALAAQLAEESRATQRHYVLANTRARWTWLAVGVALRAAAGDWSWSVFFQESLGLAFACVVLVSMLTRIVSRLRATREALAQVEHGDLTVQTADPESDELGYLGASVNRTTEAIAEIVRQVQQQAQELAAMAQQLAASAQEVQLTSQQISATAQQLSRGTEIGRASCRERVWTAVGAGTVRRKKREKVSAIARQEKRTRQLGPE